MVFHVMTNVLTLALSLIWCCNLPGDFLKHEILGLSAGHMKSTIAMLTATQASDTKLENKER